MVPVIHEGSFRSVAGLQQLGQRQSKDTHGGSRNTWVAAGWGMEGA